jgi:uncharacterized membrane protein
MLRIGLAYVCTGVVFLALDAGFLTLVGPRLYRPDIGAILGDSVRIAPAILFYLLYIAGLIYFCVGPALNANAGAGGWTRALTAGVVLGLLAYGTYDLTCQSVMRVWTWRITLVDMAWGAFASGAASAVGLLATSALKSKLSLS